MSVVEQREPAAALLADDLADTVARRLSALAEPTRLKLVAELSARRDASVQDLAEAVGGSLPNVSKHLQILHQSGIVIRRKEGTFVRYRIAGEHVRALVHYSVRILGNARRRRDSGAAPSQR
jgi:DNA-binding transcriptional ArsR family regulator